MEGDARSGRAGRTVARSHCVRARTLHPNMCNVGGPLHTLSSPDPPGQPCGGPVGRDTPPPPSPPGGRGSGQPASPRALVLLISSSSWPFPPYKKSFAITSL